MVHVPTLLVGADLMGTSVDFGEVDGLPYRLVVPDANDAFRFSEVAAWQVDAVRSEFLSRGSAISSWRTQTEIRQ